MDGRHGVSPSPRKRGPDRLPTGPTPWSSNGHTGRWVSLKVRSGSAAAVHAGCPSDRRSGWGADVECPSCRRPVCAQLVVVLPGPSRRNSNADVRSSVVVAAQKSAAGWRSAIISARVPSLHGLHRLVGTIDAAGAVHVLRDLAVAHPSAREITRPPARATAHGTCGYAASRTTCSRTPTFVAPHVKIWWAGSATHWRTARASPA